MRLFTFYVSFVFASLFSQGHLAAATQPPHLEECFDLLAAIRTNISTLRWNVKAIGEHIEAIQELGTHHHPLPEAFLEFHEEVTGQRLVIDQDHDLFQYLESRGLSADHLVYIASGLQGALFSHPGLPGKAFKVMTSALASSEMFTPGVFRQTKALRTPLARDAHEPLPEGFFDFRSNYLETLRVRMAQQNPSELVYVDQTIAQEQRYRLRLKEITNRRAYEMIVLQSIAGGLKLPLMDFVAVEHIGPYFFVREFYGDSVVTVDPTSILNQLRDEMGGDRLDTVFASFQNTLEEAPGLARLFNNLVINVPSAFYSPTAYQNSGDRRRAFIIYDLD